MRAIIGCVVLAGALTACGGEDGTMPDSKAQVPGTVKAAEGSISCTDEPGDVKVTGAKRAAPKFTDLTEVTWARTATGANVRLTAGAAVPARLPKTKASWGQVTYRVLFRQGSLTTLVQARLEGTAWKVASGKKVINARPRVEKGALLLDLPRLLPAGSATINLAEEVTVGAAVRAQAKKKGKVTGFADADCPGAAGEATQAWPVAEADDDDGGIKIKVKKKKRR